MKNTRSFRCVIISRLLLASLALSGVVAPELYAAPVSGAAIYVIHGKKDPKLFPLGFTHRIDVFNRQGQKIASHGVKFFSFDDIASGDVTGDGLAEILISDDGVAGNFISPLIGDVHIFSSTGTLIRILPKTKVNFTEHDGFAVGDVTGDGIAEIIIANDGDQKARIFDQFGNKIAFPFGTFDLNVDFNKGNGFAVGDLDGDGKAEILVAHQGDHNIVIFNRFGERVFGINGSGEFPADFNGGNRFAVGDVDGDAKEEILIGHQEDHNIVIFDRFGNRVFGINGRGDFPADFALDRLAVEHSARDSDGDGLLDTWEINGLRDTNGNLILDANGCAVLPPGRANPMHKDLFLELDWAPGQQPTRAAIASLKAAFAAAPITAGGINNPDGLSGINLFVDTGSMSDAIGLVGDNLGGGNQLPAMPAVGCLDSNFYSMKNGNPGPPAIPAQFDPNRARVFRYGISGDPAVMPPCIGGRGEFGGNDFIEYNHDAGTIMHELGHTLALRHGGNEDANCKPNYISVMNYDNQFGIGRVAGGPIVDYSPPRTFIIPGSIPLQFARGATPLPTLIEFFLAESIILDPSDAFNKFVFVDSTGAKVAWPLNLRPDYNANGIMTELGLKVNIDTVGLCKNNDFSVLTGGFDDWTNIAINFHHFGDSANGAINPETEPEVSLQDLVVLEQELNRNEVTTDLRIIRSGFRYNPSTHRFLQQLTLQNVTSSPMFGPISLVLDHLSSNATLVNGTGVTANFPPLDSPFIIVNVGANNMLDPQARATVVLEFANPTNAGIAYSTRLLAGDLPP